MRLDQTSLNEHYAKLYARDRKSEWRELGAQEKARSVLLLIQPPVGTVADVGCGEGSLLAALDAAMLARDYVGYEVSPAAIDAARQREYRSPVAFDLFDGEHIRREDDAFDVGILSHVLEHVADPRSLLIETARVARRVVLEVPLDLHLRTHRFEWDDTGHINVFNRRSIRYLVESCGLQIARERIYCPRREAHAFISGRRGEMRWALKRAALRFGGEAIFTYHYAAIAERS
jgi:SAM-dependent methyltransferase